MARNDIFSEFSSILDDFVEDQLEELTAVVSKIGEDALTIARDEHIYKAQTGNLQSSVGFAVLRDGAETGRSGFNPVPGPDGGDGKTGAAEGRKYLDQILSEESGPGISLVMVAGMDYAGYVEDKGLDVLKSAEAHIRNEFDKLCRGQI